jgi:translation initiation factor 2 alpha subunit (eIF-2alpha)
LVAVFEEAANQARGDIQVALHPHNVRAQHVQALEKLQGEVNDVLDVLKTPGNLDLVTNKLDIHEQDRFTKAYRLLKAEKKLLKSAAKLATKFPRL